MTRAGRLVVLPLISLLAVAVVAIAVARSDSGPAAEVRVWQSNENPRDIHVSARAAGGSWETMGTVRLTLDRETANKRYRYGDFAVPAAEATAEAGIDEDEDAEGTRNGVIEGRVYFERGPVELPEGAVVTVRLLDISLADASSITLGEQVIDDAGRLPVAFRVPYDRDLIDERNDYSMQATIRHGGRLLYINDTVHTVLSRGSREDSDIEVICVQCGR